VQKVLDERRTVLSEDFLYRLLLVHQRKQSGLPLIIESAPLCSFTFPPSLTWFADTIQVILESASRSCLRRMQRCSTSRWCTTWTAFISRDRRSALVPSSWTLCGPPLFLAVPGR
jgi:hypothetical protein